MSDGEGWLIHVVSDAGEKSLKGPFETIMMEDFARRGVVVAETTISHPRYTKGRVVEARRIARFFNIFSNVSGEPSGSSSTGISVRATENQLAPISLGLTERKEEEEVGGIGRFMADGQDPTMICKLAERVDGICTRDEHPLYMAVQQRPVMNVSPDAIVLTNRRVIIFRQKVLGRLQFVDVLWLNVADVHMSEDMLGATISIRSLNDKLEQISHLPKSQARKVYRIAQDMEEKMVELRRERSMEERRAGAMNVTVNNDLSEVVKLATAGNATAGSSADDPLKSLKSLKAMLDADLISQDEYDQKKKQILERM